MSDFDSAARIAAFDHVRRVAEVRGHLTAADLSPGFSFQGERLPLINPQRGIFKARKMRFLLSIRTVFPKPGARVWYDDQKQVHKQIYQGDDAVDYAFMGKNPEVAENRWLREAMENKIPIMYFLGVSPGKYEAVLPAFIVDWNETSLKARVAFGILGQSDTAIPGNAPERRYALRIVKQRLHQGAFREAVISAYRGRCAISGLPETMLLDAAHIVEDQNEKFGHPIVPNGVPLSKIHHTAFDAHLIGIDADYRIHVARRLLDQKDGPMLEALKSLNGGALKMPHRRQDYPDRDRLAFRFKRFLEVQS
jgi:putative restriction endonuclease